MKTIRKEFAAIDLRRLTNVQDRGNKITAVCPACRKQGHDKTGDHLVLYPKKRDGNVVRGGYACIKFKDKTHQKWIYEISGVRRDGQKLPDAEATAKPLDAKEWPDLKEMDEHCHRILKEGFRISYKAQREASRRGVLHAGQIRGKETWVITDSSCYVRQDQRLDGEPIDPSKPKQRKRTLGSPSWPIGLDRADEYQRWWLTEGNTDFLAAFELMARGNGERAAKTGIACFLGAGCAGNPHPKVIEKLAGKDVMIAFDNDEAGNKAARKLFHALKHRAGRIRRLELPLGSDLKDMVIRAGAKRLPSSDMRETLDAPTEPIVTWTDEDPVFESKEKLEALAPEVVLDGLLYAGSKMMVGGVAKIGKSLFTMDLASHLAEGKKFLRWKPSRPLYVVYVDAELHEWELKQRAGRCLDSTPSKRLGLLSLRQYPGWRNWEKLTDLLSRQADGADLIVLDCLYKFNDAQDENSNSGMKQVGERLDALCRETGAAVILVHHFGKGNQAGRDTVDRFRGASSLAGEMDALVSITRHEEEFHYVIEAEARSFPPPRPFVAELSLNHFRLSKKNPAKRKKPGFQQQVSDEQIRDAIPKEGTSIELNEVAEQLEITRQGLNKRVAVMPDLCLVKIKSKETGRKCMHIVRKSTRYAKKQKEPSGDALLQRTNEK